LTRKPVVGVAAIVFVVFMLFILFILINSSGLAATGPAARGCVTPVRPKGCTTATNLKTGDSAKANPDEK
jgi:hypothetical protein